MKQKNLTERWQAFRQKPTAASEQTTQKNNGRRREFVVIGMGRFGKSVATTLVSLGHDVLAIDSDKYRVQELSTELPNIIRLDATNAEALRQVGIENFDTGLVCMSGNFENNLLATTLLLKFGVKRVISKAKTHTQRTILETIGAHKVILPEHEAGVHLGRQLATNRFIDYLEVNEGFVKLLGRERACQYQQARAGGEVHGHVVVRRRLSDRRGPRTMKHATACRGRA